MRSFVAKFYAETVELFRNFFFSSSNFGFESKSFFDMIYFLFIDIFDPGSPTSCGSNGFGFWALTFI